MHTVAEILDRFESEYLPTLSPRSQRDYTRHLRHLKVAFGSRNARSLRPKDIEQFLQEKRTKGATQRVRVVSTLSSAFSKAREWGMVEQNPCWYIQRPRAQSHRRYVTNEEFESVKALAKSKPLESVMSMVRLTGRAQGEVVTLRWADVDFRHKFMTFREPKSRLETKVPITPQIRAILDDCASRSRKSEYVVVTHRGERYTSEGFRALWQRTINKWVQRGGSRFNFHDLRASHQLQAESDSIPPEIRAIAEHPKESPAVELKRWVRLTDKATQAAIAKDIAALANFGGGNILFGFYDDGTLDAEHPGSLSGFDHDAVTGIVDKYLTGNLHCDVYKFRPSVAAEDCVAITVPPCGSYPICAKRDGPQVNGVSQGIQIARYYTRVNGPKSEPITTPEQWSPIIERCVMHERQRLLHSLLDGMTKLLRPFQAENEASVSTGPKRKQARPLKPRSEAGSPQHELLLVAPGQGGVVK